jgi:D-amino-acid dehydrogenase
VKVVVVGAGVVGLATAFALAEAGVDVVVLERNEGPGLETSFANGSLLHPSLVEPWNSPGILATLLRSLGREDAAVLLRLRALHSLFGWGWRFVRESSVTRFERNALKNLRLARYSLELMGCLRERTGIDYHYYRRGTLIVFRDANSYRRALRWYDRLVPHGIELENVHAMDVVRREPRLAAVADHLVGGLFAPNDEGGDPYAFCVSMVHHLRCRGVVVRFGQNVQRLLRSRQGVTGAMLTSGEVVDAGRTVLAAGSHSVALARSVGLRVPVRPAKGYSLTLPRGNAGTAPLVPVVDTALHMAVTPVGNDRIRVAGTAEFAGYDPTIQPARVENLSRLLGKLYPEYAAELAGVDRREWAAFRPMCADGVPLIGLTSLPNLVLNTGHGHIGWTTAAGSGRLAADIVLGRQPALSSHDYSPARFRL